MDRALRATSSIAATARRWPIRWFVSSHKTPPRRFPFPIPTSPRLPSAVGTPPPEKVGKPGSANIGRRKRPGKPASRWNRRTWSSLQSLPANHPVEPQRFPEIIETERLRLRRYRDGDADGILELARDNRARLVREFAQIAGLETVGDAQAFIAEKYSQWESGQAFCYGIWSKPESELIGQIQIKNIAWEIPSAELGYFIGGSWQRQGYASE